jgi:hypothetical protein
MRAGICPFCNLRRCAARKVLVKNDPLRGSDVETPLRHFDLRWENAQITGCNIIEKCLSHNARVSENESAPQDTRIKVNRAVIESDHTKLLLVKYRVAIFLANVVYGYSPLPPFRPSHPFRQFCEKMQGDWKQT